MKTLNLGKTAILLLFPFLLLAGSVSIEVDKPAVYAGDSVSFTIKAKGESVKFPDITDIEGFSIIGTSNSQSTVIINGKVDKSISKTYTFAPTKDVTIPSFKIEIDNKTYETKPLKIKILHPSASTGTNEPVQVEIKAQKETLYVGEPVKVDVILKQRADFRADKMEISEPKFKDFWVKKLEGVDKGVDGEYITQTYSYIIFPQKAGDFTINPIFARIGKAVRVRQNMGGLFNDPFFHDPFFNSFNTRIQWKKIFSNSLTFHVKALPDNLEVYGDYIISAKVDKTKVKANKPVNLTVTIAGEGNIDDIKKFDPDIDNAVVYADEPKISAKVQNNKYVGTFTQKIAVIAENSFTIPSLEFTYFDKNLKKPVTKKTKPIKIEVIGGVKKEHKKPVIEEQKSTKKEITPTASVKEKIKTVVKTEDSYIKYLFLFTGFIVGIFSVLGYLKLRSLKLPKKEIDIIKKIKKAKNDKKLFEVLLPYAKDDEFISKTLQRLEENIYNGNKNKIDKEELIEYFEDKEER